MRGGVVMYINKLRRGAVGAQSLHLSTTALPLPALAAALAVVAGLAGLEGVDLAAVDLVDDARLGGMALKSFLLYEHPEQSSA